jgi:nitrate/nitrite transport system ATP-binding protein
MVAGMPLAMTIGAGNKPSIPIVNALVLSRNGNAITLNNSFKEMGVETVVDLKMALSQNPDKISTFGVVHPSSMHDLMLRYWLASGGIDPDRDVSLTIISPALMVSHLKSGNIQGYCVGEPWNSRAVQEGLGYVVATDQDIWDGHPEKVLGVREDWAAKYPQTHIALVRALLRACEYCDDRRNREEILGMLCQPHYVASLPEYTRPGFIDPYDRGGVKQNINRFYQFYVDQANCPGRAEDLWILTQLARWGYAPFPRNWVEIVERVRRSDLFSEACRGLELPDMENTRHSFSLFDGVTFNPDDPIGYLERFSIRRDYRVSEILLDNPLSEVNP